VIPLPGKANATEDDFLRSATSRFTTVALHVPEIVWELIKISSPWIRPRSLFSQGAFVRMDALNTPAKFEVCSFGRS